MSTCLWGPRNSFKWMTRAPGTERVRATGTEGASNLSSKSHTPTAGSGTEHRKGASAETPGTGLWGRREVGRGPLASQTLTVSEEEPRGHSPQTAGGGWSDGARTDHG